jgi:hypothetical protein
MGITWEKEAGTGDLWLKTLRGSQYVIPIILGGLIMTGSAVLLVFILLGMAAKDFIPLGAIMFPFGLLFFMAGLSNKSRQFNYYVRFDVFHNRLEFYRDKPGKGYSFPFSEIDRIFLNTEVRRTQGSGSGGSTRSRTYNVYVIYLIKKDGAAFWLDTLGNVEEMREKARLLLATLPISCEDRTGSGLAKESINPYKTAGREIFQLSRGVEISNQPDGSSEILLRRRITPTGYLTLFLIFFFMGGLVGVLIYNIIRTNVFLALFFSPFALVPVGIILFIVFLMQKHYRLILKRDSLIAKIEFKTSILNRKMGKEVSIPRNELRSVRLNRFDGGGFRLQLGLSKDFSIPDSTTLLFSAASFGAAGIPGIEEEETVLPLWEMTPDTTDAEGASFADLAAIEQHIQEFYRPMQLE